MQGIYKIRCLPEDRIYIGSSVDIKRRWRSHRYDLRWQKHHCAGLQEAWIKYEETDFVWEIVEIVVDKEDLPKKELFHLGKAKNPYNTSAETHNPMRNQEAVKRNLESRGDKQSGYKGSGAKFTKEQYLTIYKELLGPRTTADIAQEWIVNTSTIQAIADGKTHKWLSQEPEYQEMLVHRARIKKMGRLYKYQETDGRPPIKAKSDQIKETNKLTVIKRSNVASIKTQPKPVMEPLSIPPPKESISTAPKPKQEPKPKREPKLKPLPKVKKPKKLGSKVFSEIVLKHKDGSILSATLDELQQMGFEESYIAKLISGKLLSYKGYRFMVKKRVRREIIVDATLEF